MPFNVNLAKAFIRIDLEKPGQRTCFNPRYVLPDHEEESQQHDGTTQRPINIIVRAHYSDVIICDFISEIHSFDSFHYCHSQYVTAVHSCDAGVIGFSWFTCNIAVEVKPVHFGFTPFPPTFPPHPRLTFPPWIIVTYLNLKISSRSSPTPPSLRVKHLLLSWSTAFLTTDQHN